MDKQTRSRGLRLTILSLAVILTVSMSDSTGYASVRADGQAGLMGPSSSPVAGQSNGPAQNAGRTAPFGPRGPARRDETASAGRGSRPERGWSTDVLQTADLQRRPLVKISGWISDTSTDRWRVGDRVLQVDHGSLIEGNVQAGRYAVVIARVDDDGQLHAQSVSLQPPSGGIGYTFEFRCLIQEIDPRYWIVCNRVVLITENTSIQGQPEIGSLAEVKGIRMSGDAILARSIRVVVASAYAEVEFEGSIESVANDVWIVNGIAVAISPVTVIRGVPEPGLTAEVKGVLQPGGSVLAKLITVKGAELTPQVDIEGLVERIEPTSWLVAGTQVFIGSTTFVDDSRAPAEVGMWAQVRALRRQDSSLLALRIRLSRPN